MSWFEVIDAPFFFALGYTLHWWFTRRQMAKMRELSLELKDLLAKRGAS